MNRKQLLLTAQVSILIFFGIVTSSYSQDTTAIYSSLDIPVKGYGISLGNSRTFTGLRINFYDYRVQRVTGINITLWAPAEEKSDAIIKGAAIGVFWPQAKQISGLSAGSIAVAANDLRGISISLGVIGKGNCTGIQTAGTGVTGIKLRGITATSFFILSREKLWGIQTAGLGMIVGNEISGFQMAPVGIRGVSLSGISITGILLSSSKTMRGIQSSFFLLESKRISGISIGGLMIGNGAIRTNLIQGIQTAGFSILGDSIRGFSAAGFTVGGTKLIQGIQTAGFSIVGNSIRGFSAAGFTVGGTKNRNRRLIKGLQIAGFSVGSEGNVEGISIAGFSVFGAQKLKGFTLSGVAAGSNKNITGFTAALGWITVGTKTTEGILNGVSLSAINYINGRQNGIAIGLLNKANTVRGVQIGAFNIITSNPGLTKILPLFNTQFR